MARVFEARKARLAAARSWAQASAERRVQRFRQAGCECEPVPQWGAMHDGLCPLWWAPPDPMDLDELVARLEALSP